MQSKSKQVSSYTYKPPVTEVICSDHSSCPCVLSCMLELKTAPPSQGQARRKQKGCRGSAHTMHRHSSCIAVPPKSCLETGQLLAEEKADSSYLLIISSSRMTLPSTFSLLSKVLCIQLIVSLKPLVASFHTVSCCIYFCFQLRLSKDHISLLLYINILTFISTAPNSSISPVMEYHTDTESSISSPRFKLNVLFCSLLFAIDGDGPTPLSH